MREGPLYAAALLAGMVAVFVWTTRRERHEHVSLAEAVGLGPEDVPEHTVRPFVVVNKGHNGHVLFCERCRLYLLGGQNLTHDDAVKRAVWHAEAHYMEAV